MFKLKYPKIDELAENCAHKAKLYHNNMMNNEYVLTHILISIEPLRDSAV